LYLYDLMAIHHSCKAVRGIKGQGRITPWSGVIVPIAAETDQTGACRWSDRKNISVLPRPLHVEEPSHLGEIGVLYTKQNHPSLNALYSVAGQLKMKQLRSQYS